jgi:GDP-4-dehydro-6-deoxy-D-mannose reductase
MAASTPVMELDQYHQCDVCSEEDLDFIIRKLFPQKVFHLAGLSVGNDREVISTNVQGSARLLRSVLRRAPECRVLLVGSAAEYGHLQETDLPVTEDHPCRPYSAYGIGKHASTLLGLKFVKKYNLKIVIARPFNVIGPGMSPDFVVGAVLTRIKEALLAGQSSPIVIKVGNTSSIRDFVSVDDVVQAYVSMMNCDLWGEVFNICSGRPTSVQSVLEMLARYVPGGCRFETDENLKGNSTASTVYGSYERARIAFGYHPTVPLEVILQDECKRLFAGLEPVS